MKRKGSVLLSVLLAMSLIVGCGSGTTSQQAEGSGEVVSQTEETTPKKRVLQLGYAEPEVENNHNFYFASRFKEYVEEFSGGTIEIQIVGNNQLGTEQEMMEGMQMGSNDLALVINMVAGSFVPQCRLYDLPYLYPDAESAYRVIDSEVGEQIQTAAEEQGLVLLGQGLQGFRHILNNDTPIRTLEDVKGLKIRTPESELYMDAFKAMGANPVPISGTEVYTALQQGTCDGVELPYAPVVTQNFFEVCKYLSTTGHFFSADDLFMSKSVLESFTEEEQGWFREAGKLAAQDQRAFMAEEEAIYYQTLIDNGMEINDDVDKEAFRTAMQPIYEKYADQIGTDLVEQAMELLK